MYFFGIAPFEVLLVLLIAFILFGPERLIELSKTAGKVMKYLSRSASELNEKLNQEIKMDVTSDHDETQKPVNTVKKIQKPENEQP